MRFASEHLEVVIYLSFIITRYGKSDDGNEEGIRVIDTILNKSRVLRYISFLLKSKNIKMNADEDVMVWRGVDRQAL